MTHLSIPLRPPVLPSGPNRALIDGLDALRPPKRHFLARLYNWVMHRREDRVGLAKLVHSNMVALRSRATLPAAGGAMMAEGPPRIITGLATALGAATGHASACFDAAQRYAAQNASAATDLASITPEAFIAQLSAQLQITAPAGRSLSDGKARAMAEAAYGGLVAGLVRRSEEGGREAMQRRIVAVTDEASSADVVQRLAQLAACADDLRLDLAMSPQTRLGQETLIHQVRGQLEASRRVDFKSLMAQIGDLTADLTVDTAAETLAQRRASARAVHTVVGLSAGLSPLQHVDLRVKLAQAERHIDALANRGRLLESLQAQPRLRSALEGLKAERFVAASEGLRFILDTVADAGAAQTVAHLGEAITDASQVRWLMDVHQGDHEVVDLLFAGARWDDDAYRLKRAAMDRDSGAQVARAEAEQDAGAIPASSPDALREDHAKALHTLDIQHNLRMAATELNRVMQELSRGSKEHRHLPVSAFTALSARSQSDGAGRPTGFVPWLVQNGSSFVKDNDLLIADWIRLSLYVAASGDSDQVQVRVLLDSLGLEGMDTSRIRAHVGAGFKSVADVVACRERLQAFAREVEKSPLLQQLHEKRFIGDRLERITGALIGQATGRTAQTVQGEAVALAIREKFEAVAPWVQHEHELASYALPAWAADPVERAKATEQHHLVAKALSTYDKLQTRRGEADVVRLMSYLQDPRLEGFSLDTWRVEPGSKATPAISQLDNARERFTEVDNGLHRYDEIHARIASAIGGRQEAQAAAFIQQAARIAILQEAAEHPEGFAPREHVGAIMKRLKDFGLDNVSASPYVRGFIGTVAEGLSADKRSAEQLCADFDPTSTRNKVAQSVTDAVAAVRNVFDSSPMPSDATAGKAGSPLGPIVAADDEARRGLAEQRVRTQLKDLQPGQQFAVTFGVYGEASVKVPTPVAVEVSAQTSVQRHRGITISRNDQGRLAVHVNEGRAVRQAVSASTIRNLLQVTVATGRCRAQGDRFEFDDDQSCRDFLLAMVREKPVTEADWGNASVQRTASASQDGGANLTATLDAIVAKLVMAVDVQAGATRETSRSAHGTTERLTRHYKATARAEGSAARGRLSAEAETGIDLQLRKTLDQRAGLLTGASFDVTASVVGGNQDRCLRAVVPAGLADQLPALGKHIGTLSDGTEVSVRFRLAPEAVHAARALLEQASAQLRDAALAPQGPRRMELEALAQARVREAYDLTRSAGNYRAESLNWTTRFSMSVEKSVAGMAKKFARDEARQEKSIPLKAPEIAPAASAPSARWLF